MNKKLVIAIIITGAIIYLIDDFYVTVDACMDRGGCWDSDAKVCRMEEPNAQELCDKSIGR